MEGDLELLVFFSFCFGGFYGLLEINNIVYEIMFKKFFRKFEYLVYKVDINKIELRGFSFM